MERTRPRRITQGTGANVMNFSYAYNDVDNIVSETAAYVYDALGQLIRVNDPNDTTAGANGTTWGYEYDRGGNITSKIKYVYIPDTLGFAMQTIPYTYGGSNPKDKLTAYNGNAITYDAIGNPLTYDGWAYTWQAGR